MALDPSRHSETQLLDTRVEAVRQSRRSARFDQLGGAVSESDTADTLKGCPAREVIAVRHRGLGRRPDHGVSRYQRTRRNGLNRFLADESEPDTVGNSFRLFAEARQLQ